MNEKERKDLRWTISFLIMLFSVPTLLIVFLAIPMYVDRYTEGDPVVALVVSLILWAIPILWAAKEQG